MRRHTEGWETVTVAASAATAKLDGVRVERKGTGVALHFRGAPAQQEAVKEIAEVLAREFSLELRPGRMVCDLIIPGPGKGEAIAGLITERGLNRVLVAGDDIADVEAFEMLRASGVEAVIVGVASAEAPDDLAAHADLLLEGPAELATFLRSLADV
jgi:trehalose 6-phosphate phosphatase